MAAPSRNVFACKALKCTQALARGLWNNGILSPYLFILTNESKTVRAKRLPGASMQMQP
jgi:hypothetical protein